MLEMVGLKLVFASVVHGPSRLLDQMQKCILFSANAPLEAIRLQKPKVQLTGAVSEIFDVSGGIEMHFCIS
ncbi:MAG: hypothetical protein E7L01_16575 [Paenibacillus macerans]|uniref:hypothetical protein n=1 Tax=Paenibacillus macerans TaxID=44252 RepID=UPI000FDAA83B|nr:hypothetical protein [Paenibacillus macerans]MCY7561276.1 hypothetical protein [Paenibacillus macerans]MDU7474923.1 hypothetical protein [Paenibacillus macerans]MEC0137639.1 hypothetical protein [Paenibacillus macerans]MEC0149844.1 hypothetical protein [Paenibacillus macerans]